MKHPRLLTDTKIHALKSSFVEALFDHNQMSNVAAEGSGGYSLERVEQQLGKFVEEGNSALSMASSALSTGDQSEIINKR